jgi:diguanylate cyclase (GGDEF)-like protein
MFLAGVFQSLRIFIAEFHRPHAKAVKENDVKSRCRVLGFVMFIIAMLFILCLLVFALLQSTVSAEINPKLAVSLIDFVHAPSIIGGMIMGVFIYTPIRFLEFASSHTIKAENYLTVTALSFFSTFFWEWATNSLTGLSLKDLSRIDIIAGCFITVGALVMAISKIKNIRKGNSKEEYIYREMQDWQIAQDSFDIVNNTMEYFGNDIEKVRRALNIPEDVIITIVSDENQEVAFKPDILKKVERNYRNNVARIDSLTEIYNKAGFVIKFKEIAQNSEQISMFYIDLNKFKPVNDTYGHKAGDFVLKESAKRLNTMFMNLGFTGRLGGDEFAVVLLNKNKDESKKYIEDIKLKIEEKIKFNEMDFNISASIGLANYPEDTNNPDDLMSLADKLMYKDKKEDER